MQAYIHETIIKDISDVIKDVKDADMNLNSILKNYNKNKFKSISAKSAGLVMVFPVIVFDTISISSATAVAKAIERKAVTMLQMIFAANQLTNATDGFDFVSKVHKNLDMDTVDMDKFIKIVGESFEYNPTNELRITQEQYNVILNDMKAMNITFESSISENGLDSFRISNSIFGTDVIKEAKTDELFDGYQDRMSKDSTWNLEKEKSLNQMISSEERDKNVKKQTRINNLNTQHQMRIEDERLKMGKDKELRDVERDSIEYNLKNKKMDIDASKDTRDRLKNQLLDTDVKKANELVPSLMIINFKSLPDANQPPIEQQVIVGVKSKIYSVPSDDIIERLRKRNQDRNWLVKLIKVSTREISFFRDFLLCIDDAKIDALSQSRRGTYFKIFKILERRSAVGRLKRRMGTSDADVASISTMAISKEDCEYLKKMYMVDVEKPNVIRPIMESLNLMGFVIVDETLEVDKFIFDTGEDVYESLSFNSLERESSDNGYKKVINLMTKLSR